VLCLVRPTTSCSPALHRFAHACAAPGRVGRHWSPQGELHPSSFPSSSELPYSTSSFHQSSSGRQKVYTADHLARDRAMAAVDPRRHREPPSAPSPTRPTLKTEPYVSKDPSSTLSRPSTASSSPDSGHLHPCPRLDYIAEVKVFPGS
jgi:hypothetical protein